MGENKEIEKIEGICISEIKKVGVREKMRGEKKEKVR